MLHQLQLLTRAMRLARRMNASTLLAKRCRQTDARVDADATRIDAKHNQINKRRLVRACFFFAMTLLSTLSFAVRNTPPLTAVWL